MSNEPGFWNAKRTLALVGGSVLLIFAAHLLFASKGDAPTPASTSASGASGGADDPALERFDFTAMVGVAGKPVPGGFLAGVIDGIPRTASITPSGTAVFRGLPRRLIGQEVALELDAKGYRFAGGETRVVLGVAPTRLEAEGEGPFTARVLVKGPGGAGAAPPTGTLSVSLDDQKYSGTIDARGEVFLRGIPAQYLGEKVPVKVSSPRFMLPSEQKIISGELEIGETPEVETVTLSNAQPGLVTLARIGGTAEEAPPPSVHDVFAEEDVPPAEVTLAGFPPRLGARTALLMKPAWEQIAPKPGCRLELRWETGDNPVALGRCACGDAAGPDVTLASPEGSQASYSSKAAKALAGEIEQQLRSVAAKGELSCP